MLILALNILGRSQDFSKEDDVKLCQNEVNSPNVPPIVGC